MYSFAYDKNAGLMVGVLKIKPYFNEDEDYAVMLDSIARNESGSRRGDPFKLILVIEPDVPMPNAIWRKKFAESRTKTLYPFLFVTVTSSSVLRGVLTMVNWVNPPKMGSATQATATFDEAVEWVEEKAGKKLPIAKRLLQEANSARR